MSELYVGHNVRGGADLCCNILKDNYSNAGQIFTRPPHQFKIHPYDFDKWEKLKNQIIKNKMKIVIHGSYLINFCKSHLEDYVYKVLIEDLKISEHINSLGVIIHMGHNTEKVDDEIAFNNYIKHLTKVLEMTSHLSAKIILETGAGQGKEIATRLNELGKIRKSLPDNLAKRVSFCLDTCHMFSAGYDLRNKLIVSSLENYIEMTLGWDNISVIHLNDSKCGFNCKKDRHEDIGFGFITNKMKHNIGFIKFIKICVKYKVPLVLETIEEFTNYSNQISMLKSWILDFNFI